MVTLLRFRAGGGCSQWPQQRVDHRAHPQQVGHGGERCICGLITVRQRLRGVVKISPRRWDQRARTVGKHEHEMQSTAPMRPSKDGERLAYEGMPLATHRHPLGETVKVVVGSMSCVPSTPWTTGACGRFFTDGYVTAWYCDSSESG